MKITQDIHEEVARMGATEIAALGCAEAEMAEKSAEILEGGGRL